MLDTFYRNILLKSPLGYAYHRVLRDKSGESLDYEFLEVNPAFEKLTGLAAGQIVGQAAAQVIPNLRKDFDWVAFYGEIASRAGEEREIEQYVAPMQCWLRVHVFVPERDFFVTLFSDITKEKQHLEELKISQERYALAVSGSNDGIWDWDLLDNSQYLSPRWKAMLGFTEDELANNYEEAFKARLHPDDVARVEEMTRAHFAGETPVYQLEFRLRHKDGHYVWILSRGLLLRDEAGVPYRMAGSHTDITRTKENEARLIEACHAAEAANLAKSSFLANMSHEIRTPLNGIAGFLQLLADSELNAEQEEFINNIKISSDTLLTVINDILDISKIEAGKLELEETVFDLGETIEAAIIPFNVQAKAKGVQLTLGIDPRIPRYVVGDPTRLRQVLINLLSNALKFTPQGQITVSVDQQGESPGKNAILFKVTDTGIGMKEEFIEELFSPFVQADASTTRHFGGTGLGLTICHSIVHLMGGDISVTSQLGLGSTFSFALNFAIASNQAATPLVDLSSIVGKAILIVDDNQINREILRRYLQEAGASVEEATSGAQALQVLMHKQPRRFDCIILDQLMPGMSGFDLAAALRAISTTALLPLIMLTSALGGLPKETQTRLQFAGYLTKPFRRRELLSCLSRALSGGTEASATAGSEADMQLGDDGRPIRAASVDLTGKDANAADYNTELMTSSSDLPDGRTSQLHKDDAKTDQRELAILLVDDNDINLKLFSKLLAVRGFSAELARNGQEAIDSCQGKNYDIVFMDCQMPGVDGYDATRTIRQTESTSGHHALIIALTAHAMKGDAEKCYAAGMDEYLPKPVEIDKAIALIDLHFPGGKALIGSGQKNILFEPTATTDAPASPVASVTPVAPETMQITSPTSYQQIVDSLVAFAGFSLAEADEILREAIPLLTERLDVILAALRGEAPADVRHLLHQLKGTAGTIKLNEVASLARQAEMHFSQGQLDEVLRLTSAARDCLAQLSP
jgi:PAS domain S-box-containing protein